MLQLLVVHSGEFDKLQELDNWLLWEGRQYLRVQVGCPGVIRGPPHLLLLQHGHCIVADDGLHKSTVLVDTAVPAKPLSLERQQVRRSISSMIGMVLSLMLLEQGR